MPVAAKTADSTDSVEENAQHEPQPPWFLTGVTAPWGHVDTWMVSHRAKAVSSAIKRSATQSVVPCL